MERTKFSYQDHTLQAIRTEVNRVHYNDDFPYAVLADMAGVSESMVRAVAQGEREFKAANFLMLSNRLASEGNTRLAKLALPKKFAITEDLESPPTNGCLDDELADMMVALGQMKVAHDTHNDDACDRHYEEVLSILERIKAEITKS